MTQNQRILNHLETYGSITAREATRTYEIYRLAARIADLKRMGYNIESVEEVRTNSEGETKRFARYYLRGGSNGG